MWVVPQSFYSRKWQTLVQFFERITKSCLKINCVNLAIFHLVWALIYQIQVNIAQRQRNSDFVHIPHLLRTLKKRHFARMVSFTELTEIFVSLITWTKPDNLPYNENLRSQKAVNNISCWRRSLYWEVPFNLHR